MSYLRKKNFNTRGRTYREFTEVKDAIERLKANANGWETPEIIVKDMVP